MKQDLWLEVLLQGQLNSTSKYENSVIYLLTPHADGKLGDVSSSTKHFLSFTEAGGLF